MQTLLPASRDKRAVSLLQYVEVLHAKKWRSDWTDTYFRYEPTSLRLLWTVCEADSISCEELIVEPAKSSS